MPLDLLDEVAQMAAAADDSSACGWDESVEDAPVMRDVSDFEDLDEWLASSEFLLDAPSPATAPGEGLMQQLVQPTWSTAMALLQRA